MWLIKRKLRKYYLKLRGWTLTGIDAANAPSDFS